MTQTKEGAAKGTNPLAVDMSKFVGKRGYVRMKHPSSNLRGTEVDVKILDFRRKFGRSEFLVSPVAGKGQTWVTEVFIT